MKLKDDWRAVLRPVQTLRSTMLAYVAGDQEETKRSNRNDELM